MAKFNGANKVQQLELKKLHAKGISAAEAAKITKIDAKCVASFFKSFEPEKKEPEKKEPAKE